MRKSPNWSAVSQWQQLMEEWDAVSAEYQSAKVGAQDPRIGDVQRAALQSTVDRALTRLKELKASIDELVSQGAAERPIADGQFTVATIDFVADMEDTKAKRRVP